MTTEIFNRLQTLKSEIDSRIAEIAQIAINNKVRIKIGVNQRAFGVDDYGFDLIIMETVK